MKWLNAVRFFPLYWRHSPTKIFSDHSPRNADGTYVWSYTSIVQQQRIAIGSGLGAVFLVGVFLAVTILSWSPTPTAEAVGCTTPYFVTIDSPATTKTLCVAETFSMQGHWHDSDDGVDCLSSVATLGQRGGTTTISTSGGLTIASGTYSLNSAENTAGDDSPNSQMTKTVTAAVAGSYTVNFKVGVYSSSATSVVVKNQPGTPGSLSANPDSTTAITWSWADVSNEENYQVRNTSNTNLSGALAANSTSWQETGLTANTSYTRRLYSYATVDSGACNATGSDGTGATAIETPSTVGLSSITSSGITATANGSFTNLSTGSSGLELLESVTATNSGWIQTSSWAKTGLSENTNYSFTAKARNQNSAETSLTSAATAYTLADTPTNLSVAPASSSQINAAVDTFPNHGAGSSGYYFDNTTASTNSGWQSADQTWSSTSLAENTNYAFTVKYRNGNGTETSTISNSIYTWADAPTGFSLTAASATQINASIDTFTNDGSGSSGYYFANTTASTNSGWQSGDETWNSTSLSPDTSYAFTGKYRNGDSVETSSVGSSLYTLAAVPGTPAVTTWSTTSIKVTIDQNGNPTGAGTSHDTEYALAETTTGKFVQANGTLGASAVFQTYGDWGGSAGQVVTGLTPSTIYTFKIKARNGDSVETAYSSTASDTTNADTAISTIEVSAVTATSATITWTTNHAADSQVDYGTTSGYGSTENDGAMVTSHTISLTGLTAGTTYHYQVTSTGNTTVTSVDDTFETLPATQISGVSVNSITATSATITWTTNHAANSQIDYGLTSGYGSVKSNASLVTSHSIVITGLTSGSTYHYRVTSLGNTTAVTTDQTFNTPVLVSIEGPSDVTIQDEPTKSGDELQTVVIGTQLPTFSGKAEPNALITLTIHSDPLVFTTTSDADGNWSITLEKPLPKGSHTLYITVTKDGEMTDSSQEAVFQIVSHSYVPTPTIIAPTPGQIVSDATPTITGLAKSGNTIRLFIDEKLAATLAATLTSTGTGSFAFTPSTPLSAGAHTLAVEALSGDSFSTRSTPFTFTVHPPTIGPTILQLATQNGHAVIAGIGWGDTDVRVYANDKEIDIFYIGGTGVQAFSRTLPTLASGTYTIKLRAEDNKDKLSNYSNSVYFTQGGGTTPVVVTNAGTYTVQAGDSLWSIAQRVYGDGNRFGDLVQLNSTSFPSLLINPSLIKVGWQLRIK